MKNILIIVIGLLSLVAQTIYATSHNIVNYPTHSDQTAYSSSFTIYTGSLRSNIERIAKMRGWDTVVWNVPDDFDWVGTTRITATSLPNALNRILANYPLQAVFYEGNRVLLIQPRTLK